MKVKKVAVLLVGTVALSGAGYSGYQYLTNYERFIRNMHAYKTIPAGYKDNGDQPFHLGDRSATGTLWARTVLRENTLEGQALIQKLVTDFYPKSEHWDLRWNCEDGGYVIGERVFYVSRYRFEADVGTAVQTPELFLNVRENNHQKYGSEFEGPLPAYRQLYDKTGQVTCPPPQPAPE